MKRLTKLVLMSSILVLAGCANFSLPASYEQLEPGVPHWFTYDATKRGAIMVQTKTGIRFCAEPPPDVVLETMNKGLLEGGVPGVGSGKAETELSNKVTNLAQLGEAHAISLFRDALYRLCELSLNQDISPERIKEVYSQLLGAAVQMYTLQVQLQLAQELNKDPQTRKIFMELYLRKENAPQ